MKTDQELFNSGEDLNALLEKLLQQGPKQTDIHARHGGPGSLNPIDAAKKLDFGEFQKSHSLYAHHLQGGKRKAAIEKYQAYMRAVGQSNVRARKEYEQQIQQVKQAITQRGMRDRVNQSFNSPQLQEVYNQIEKSISDNSLAGVTQQYSDLLKTQSFQTAGQGLTGSSIHAERLGDLQQGQNAAAINAQNQAHQYTNGLKQQNEQQRQQLVNTVSQQNPGDSARFNSQIDAIVNQTRQLGQQYQNQATGAQIDQYGNQLQSQAIGGLLSGAGNIYSGYRQGYDNTIQQDQQQQLLKQLQQQGKP